MLSSLIVAGGIAALAAPNADRDTVARLDRAYQAAVKRNDAEMMRRVLHPNFQLVLGDGRTVGREALLDLARRGTITYELQDEEPNSQTVRVWGDTAIVTAKLLLKGVKGGQRFDRTLWFSDTYVRTESGWRYLFGQASLPLPADSAVQGAAATEAADELGGRNQRSDTLRPSDPGSAADD